MDLFLENLSDPAYKESTQFLYDLQYSGIKLGLKNILNFLKHLGNPQKKLKTIHLAGTNGKGSTAAIIESILIEAGYKVGCYTSPHLISFQERIRINRKLIDINFIDNFVKENKKVISNLKLTFFEATTGLAFKYFAEKKPDILIVESGLGGRLDSTNVIQSPLSIITKIDLDHQPYLGDTIEKISHEKAGIIFKGSEVFTSNKDIISTKIIEEKCIEVNAEYHNIHNLASIELKKISKRGMIFSYYSSKIILKDLEIPLIGMHQLENAKLAVSALLFNRTYKVEIEHIKRGLTSVLWPGRLQLLYKEPALLLDAGHNPDGFTNSLKTAKKVTSGDLHVICGIVNDKSSKDIAKIVEDYSDFIHLVDFQSKRLLPAAEFLKYFRNDKNVRISKNNCFEEIIRLLKEVKKDDTILLIGSHYLIGEFLFDWIKTKKRFGSYY